MGKMMFSAGGPVGAPPNLVYGLLRDYRTHHPRILPPEFSLLTVEEGGVGEGTVVSFSIKSGGRKRAYRVRVTEPEPGRVLRETDQLSDTVTGFIVTPEGDGSRVRITIAWQGAGGINGFFERMFAPRIVTRMLTDEISRLDRYARAQASAPVPVS